MNEIKSGDTVYTIMCERVIKFEVLSVDGETLIGVNDNGTFMFFVKGCYHSIKDCINGMKTFIGDGYEKEYTEPCNHYWVARPLKINAQMTKALENIEPVYHPHTLTCDLCGEIKND